MNGSKKRTIVAHYGCGNVGLGNRITCICAGYAAAKISNSDFAVCWNKALGCGARWEDLFKPSPLFEFTKSVPNGAIKLQVPSYMPRVMGRHYKAMGSRVFTPEYWAAWRECARSIELIDDLALPDVRGFTAVSIRANLPKRAPKEGWSEGITLPAGAFVCSDSREHFAKAMGVCQDAWSLSVPTASRDLENRGLQGVRAAARDMMMLCRADVILAIGRMSTFRNLASIGYGVPVFKLHEAKSP